MILLSENICVQKPNAKTPLHFIFQCAKYFYFHSTCTGNNVTFLLVSLFAPGLCHRLWPSRASSGQMGRRMGTRGIHWRHSGGSLPPAMRLSLQMREYLLSSSVFGLNLHTGCPKKNALLSLEANISGF